MRVLVSDAVFDPVRFIRSFRKEKIKINSREMWIWISSRYFLAFLHFFIFFFSSVLYVPFFLNIWHCMCTLERGGTHAGVERKGPIRQPPLTYSKANEPMRGSYCDITVLFPSAVYKRAPGLWSWAQYLAGRLAANNLNALRMRSIPRALVISPITLSSVVQPWRRCDPLCFRSSTHAGILNEEACSTENTHVTSTEVYLYVTRTQVFESLISLFPGSLFVVQQNWKEVKKSRGLFFSYVCKCG